MLLLTLPSTHVVVMVPIVILIRVMAGLKTLVDAVPIPLVVEAFISRLDMVLIMVTTISLALMLPVRFAASLAILLSSATNASIMHNNLIA